MKIPKRRWLIEFRPILCPDSWEAAPGIKPFFREKAARAQVERLRYRSHFMVPYPNWRRVLLYRARNVL